MAQLIKRLIGCRDMGTWIIIVALGCGLVAAIRGVLAARALTAEVREERDKATAALAELKRSVSEEGSYRILWEDAVRRHKARVGEFEELIEGLKESLIVAGDVSRSLGDERDRAVAALDKNQRWIETTLDKEVED